MKPKVTCLDCLYCKMVFPINKEDPLHTDLSFSTRYDASAPIRNLRCSKHQWIREDKTILYGVYAINAAERIGNGHGVLNSNEECEMFEDMR